MKPYLYAFASIWGTWFAMLVAASVYADVSTSDNAALAPLLVWILGIAASAFFTVVAFLTIAGGQCLDAAERRRG